MSRCSLCLKYEEIFSLLFACVSRDREKCVKSSKFPLHQMSLSFVNNKQIQQNNLFLKVLPTNQLYLTYHEKEKAWCGFSLVIKVLDKSSCGNFIFLTDTFVPFHFYNNKLSGNLIFIIKLIEFPICFVYIHCPYTF